MLKVSKNLSITIVKDIFQRKESPYDLRNNMEFTVPNVKSVFHGTKSVSYIASKIWDMVPSNIKALNNLSAFKQAIKKWKPEKCPYRLCKISDLYKPTFLRFMN